jgi:antirestriction protein ArdC
VRIEKGGRVRKNESGARVRKNERMRKKERDTARSANGIY